MSRRSSAALDDLRDVTECLRNERKRFAELLAERDAEIARLRAPSGAEASARAADIFQGEITGWIDRAERALAAAREAALEEAALVCMSTDWPDPEEICNAIRALVAKPGSAG